MSDRPSEIARFLRAAGWENAVRAPLAGDASARRYERLTGGAGTAVLMDDPARASGSAARFLSVGTWLRDRGYSAPRVFSADPANGLLLLEDLGDSQFLAVLDGDSGAENRLYSSAIGFLADLHRHTPPADLAPLDGRTLADLLTLTLDCYLPATDAPAGTAAAAIPPMVERLHDMLPPRPPVMCLRDFHAGNLIWLPGRTPPADCGLLDFQDAVAAHPAYDLVSLLQDVRRDVMPTTEAAMIRSYLDLTGQDDETFRRAYALLGAQRQLRILGVFARLCLQYGKPGYVDLLPRVWGYLCRNLAHPDLSDLSRLVHAAIPEPNAQRLQGIKDRCATIPDR